MTLYPPFKLPQALQPLLRDSPVKVQKYVLRQFAQLLPHDVEARRAFVQSGGLQLLQVRQDKIYILYLTVGWNLI